MGRVTESEPPQGDDIRGAGTYADLIEPFRDSLHLHCYRMLGSVHDAEDAVQDTLMRAWRSLPTFEGRSSMRTWLYSIATHVCLRAIERRPRRVLPFDHGPPADPHSRPGEPLAGATWIEPYPDERFNPTDDFANPEARYEQRESVELAFVALLQHLPARQRAVLILRDVLGFTGAEVASALRTTPASVYSALQRAHAGLDNRLPELSQQATLGALQDARLRAIVDRYVRAWEMHDVGALVAMLTDDVTITMPPIPTWYRGRDAVGAFLARRPLDGSIGWRVAPTRANGQLAARGFCLDSATGEFRLHHTTVLTLRGALIAAIDVFLEPWALTLHAPTSDGCRRSESV